MGLCVDNGWIRVNALKKTRGISKRVLSFSPFFLLEGTSNDRDVKRRCDNRSVWTCKGELYADTRGLSNRISIDKFGASCWRVGVTNADANNSFKVGISSSCALCNFMPGALNNTSGLCICAIGEDRNPCMYILKVSAIEGQGDCDRGLIRLRLSFVYKCTQSLVLMLTSWISWFSRIDSEISPNC